MPFITADIDLCRLAQCYDIYSSHNLILQNFNMAKAFIPAYRKPKPIEPAPLLIEALQTKKLDKIWKDGYVT